MIIATIVTITIMTTKESDDRSKIISMGADKQISDLYPPTYLH